MLPFNKPYSCGQEINYIHDAIRNGRLSGDGPYTKLCHDFFEKKWGIHKALLTTSCTDALEMAALLLDIEEGDEIIVPSYTFVSSANPFVLRGARIVFADSCADSPNVDPADVENLITNKTKVIVAVHYAGISCDMGKLMALSQRHSVSIVEDAAQAIDSYYNGQQLGTIGTLGTFSFHETKNIVCGEGGLLIVNDPALSQRAEIIREKGTNRSLFIRGQVDKYGWVDKGSSFLPSDILAAYLYAQLEVLDDIQKRRNQLWQKYYRLLSPIQEIGKVILPVIPSYATNNAHMFYLVTETPEQRSDLIQCLKANQISAAFHYQSLHRSSFFKSRHDGRELPNADNFTECLIRMPLYYDMKDEDVELVASVIRGYYGI